MSTQKSKSAHHAVTKEPTVQPTVSITEMLIREASAKAQAEAETMRLKREERERQRIAADERAKADAKRRETVEAARRAEAERQRIEAIEAAKAKRERDLAAWEATYRIYAPLAELLQEIETDRQRGVERRLKVQPYMASQERNFIGFREYVQYALTKIKDTLVTGKTA